MRTFSCPSCKMLVEALAIAVSHRCPSNKNQPTAFVRVDGKEKK